VQGKRVANLRLSQPLARADLPPKSTNKQNLPTPLHVSQRLLTSRATLGFPLIHLLFVIGALATEINTGGVRYSTRPPEGFCAEESGRIGFAVGSIYPNERDFL
jgi:hypothetical protein